MHDYNHHIPTCQYPDGKGVYQLIPDEYEPFSTGVGVLHCSATFMNINAKFAMPPLRPENAHIPLLNPICLADIFYSKTPQVISKDYAVSYRHRLFPTTRLAKPLPRPRAPIIVREPLDGRSRLLYQHTELAYVEPRTPPHKEALAPCSA